MNRGRRQIGRQSVRTFVCLFVDSSEHTAGLLRVETSTWWDGTTMIHELDVYRRTRSDHEWPDPELELKELGSAIRKATATRAAIAFHDAVVRKHFAGEDQACNDNGEASS